MLDGTEIRLHDPQRKPQDWTDLIGRTDCAVFLKNRTDSASLGPDGRPYSNPSDGTCVVFHSLDAALRFCEGKVKDLPHARCETYDVEGPAQRPLLVIVHPDFRPNEESGLSGSRRRKLVMIGLILLSIPLFWLGTLDWNSSDIAIFFGINCLVLALRFLYWMPVGRPVNGSASRAWNRIACGSGAMPELQLLFLQMVVVLVAARLMAALFRRIGQPAVLGEMAAGIVLGPSLLGRISPGMMASLFPANACVRSTRSASSASCCSCSWWAWRFGRNGFAARPSLPSSPARRASLRRFCSAERWRGRFIRNSAIGGGSAGAARIGNPHTSAAAARSGGPAARTMRHGRGVS